MLINDTPHISISKTHNAYISALPNLFHSIVSLALCENCLCNHTEAIEYLLQIVIVHSCKEKIGTQKGKKVAP